MIDLLPHLDIPPGDWGWFCNGFTHQHAGWLMEWRESGAAEQTASPAGLTLRNIHLEHTADEHSQLEVFMSDGSGNTFSRTLVDPIQLQLVMDTNGSHRALHVELRNGKSVTLYLPYSLPMEMLDGINPEMPL